MIHWGILGLGNISQRFIKSLSHSQKGKLYAAASYTKEKREHFKSNCPEVIVYDNYEDLLDDPKVDAVYIAMHHKDHYKWSKEALLKGKAVLCEKPICLNEKEIRDLCKISKIKNTFLMEAMKTRFIPAVYKLHELLNEGVIGKIKTIKTSFCGNVPYNPDSYLFDTYEGGAIYDVGIYNIASTFDYIKSEIESIKVYREVTYGVDVYDFIDIYFEDDIHGVIEVAIDRDKASNNLEIVGEKGSIIGIPFNRPQTIIVCSEGETSTYHIPYDVDDFFGQIEEVHHCLEKKVYESPRMSFQDMIKNISFMERIKKQ